VTELVLIRHGETDWNLESRWQGQTDVPLNPTGLGQALAAAERLRGMKLEAIYTSDLQRARQTAEAVAAVTGAPLRQDPRLREIRLGRWEGLTLDEIHAQDGEALGDFRRNPATARAPEGESVPEVLQRVRAALEDILQAFPEGPVAIVSHGLALAALKLSLLGQSLDTVWLREPANAAVEVFQAYPGNQVDVKGGPKVWDGG
jgi:broad specificity phosphatase PhoE